jgi:hypothetical protein
MNFTIDELEKIEKVVTADSTSFVELASIAGLRPTQDFRGADLNGVNFGNDNLAEFDLTGANLEDADLSGAEGLDQTILDGVITNSRTRWPRSFVRREHRIYRRYSRFRSRPYTIFDLL